jgi:3alpha(or 20beta)-hydroxysteroid dehydrogenase
LPCENLSVTANLPSRSQGIYYSISLYQAVAYGEWTEAASMILDWSSTTTHRRDDVADQTTSVALITGGARGQGAAHAEALAATGARVVIGDVRDEDGARRAEELSGKGLAVRYAHLDVTDGDPWAQVVAELEKREGGLDILVNNAGIIRVTPIAQLEIAEWELLQRVNATSVLLGIKAAAPAMARRGGGSIINIASTAAHRGAEGYAAYSASKAAILALTRGAALELAPMGIRVNSISPGGVSTPMHDDEPAGGTSSGAPLGRRARADEISPLVTFLASSGASYITGSDYLIDGGVTIR